MAYALGKNKASQKQTVKDRSRSKTLVMNTQQQHVFFPGSSTMSLGFHYALTSPQRVT